MKNCTTKIKKGRSSISVFMILIMAFAWFKKKKTAALLL